MKQLILLAIAVFLIFAPVKTQAAEIITNEKLITVDIGSQTLRAWENGQIVHETKVSTGMRYTPTVKGSFKIGRKYPVKDMKGRYAPYPPYHLKNVPHVMFFHGAYAIHGAYWHNKFGTRASHGCVNVPLASAEWLFNWAEPGTRVEVY